MFMIQKLNLSKKERVVDFVWLKCYTEKCKFSTEYSKTLMFKKS